MPTTRRRRRRITRASTGMAANPDGRVRASGWQRPPAVADSCMVASSHPLVTQAGLRSFERGGNAVDAALAMAAVAIVAEPNTNGLGGDMFAIVYRDGALEGLNGSGRSASILRTTRVAASGPNSVTVPGAVRGWADLADQFGRFGLDVALAAAADLADRGVRCTSRIADFWTLADVAPWPAPGVGSVYRLPELARTLRTIAEHGPDAFYGGEVARQISRSTCPNGFSRSGVRITGSRSASCRRTAKGLPRSSPSPSTTASSRRCTARSRQ
jgi:gamma-glutamyltranspeptidase/glutathione hydrolase